MPDDHPDLGRRQFSPDKALKLLLGRVAVAGGLAYLDSLHGPSLLNASDSGGKAVS